MDKPPEMSARGCGDNRAVNRRAGLRSGCNIQSLKRYKHPLPKSPEESPSQREVECPSPGSSCTDRHQQAWDISWLCAIAFKLVMEASVKA